MENPNEIRLHHQTQSMFVHSTLPHKYFYCDGDPMRFPEQAESFALGKQADWALFTCFAFRQFLLFQGDWQNWNKFTSSDI